MEIQFNDEQLTAIRYCVDLKRRVVGVTGEAGTGKTTIIRKAYSTLRGLGRTPVLSAPTGRAARRIFEATGIPAITVHKLLEYGKPNIDEHTGEAKETTAPGRHRDKPLEYSDVIVDEFMMINHELYRNLLDALRPGARLLAFGDVHQLPPIEEYEIKTVSQAPFEQVLALPSSVSLSSVYRQGEMSGVLSNARLIREGKAPKKNDDFAINVTEYPIKALREHIESSGVDYSKLDNQIISPARKGKLGVHALNSVLQAYYQPDGILDGIPLPREKWMEAYPATVSVGEKVICNENNYDLRDFWDRFTQWEDEARITPVWRSFVPPPDNSIMLNGEIGIVTELLPDGAIDIDFGDRVVHVPASFRDYIPKYDRIVVRDPRKKLDLAYAVTTHKMQGSECSNICIVLHSHISPMINRNNLYTAVTRAKDKVFYITDSKQLLHGAKFTSREKDRNRDKAKNGGWKIGDA